MIDLMVLGVVKLMERRLCRLVDGSMHHMVSTVNVQKTMPQQVSVVSTTKVTVHKILSLVFNAANSINKTIPMKKFILYIALLPFNSFFRSEIQSLNRQKYEFFI